MAKQSSIENPKLKTKKKTSKSDVNILHGIAPYVISKGEEVGVPTPRNEILMALVRGIEMSQQLD